MPHYVVDRLVEALNERKIALNGAKVLIIGLAYKPDVDDDRESPSYVMMSLLKSRGAGVSYYDPHVPVIRPTREYLQWSGLRSIEWNAATVAAFDAVFVATAHNAIDFSELARWARLVVDIRNAVPARESEWKLWKA